MRRLGGVFGGFGPSWGRLGGVLEVSWAILEESWCVLGCLGGSLKSFGTPWGRLGEFRAILEASWMLAFIDF